MKEFNPHNAYDTLERIKNQYAKAEGLVAGLEAKKKAIIAIMMKKSNENALGAQEREAYASKEYEEYCEQIDTATANKTLLKLEVAQAQMEFEAWRTEQATNRNIERMTK
jgi:hypothetical protein